jgi:glycosyltransferase involved in cell wall biosynthesis
MRVCMLAYTFYDGDNRVRRYAESLAKRGDQVDAIVLRLPGQERCEVLKGVRVYRIQERIVDEKARLSYVAKLMKFFFRSSFFLTFRHIKRSYHLIHVHSVPDFEVFAATIPKLLGSKIILDIHDLLPEFYASKFNGGKRSTVFKALTFLEKLSAEFADHVIISNHIWHERINKRSVPEGKCSVLLNYPDPAVFYRRDHVNEDGRIILIYPGSLNRHQGVDIAIRAFSKIRNQIPQAEFHIYGRGVENENLQKMVVELGLQDKVKFMKQVSLEMIAGIMANADLGIIPKRNDPFGGEAFSTKILEFMSLGVPVVVSATKIDQYYFNDSVVRFFEPGDVESLASSMLEMIENSSLRETLAANALKFVENFSWEKRKWEYLDLVDRLTKSATWKQ